MSTSRRGFLRGLATATGALSAARASAQHVHQPPAGRAGQQPTPSAEAPHLARGVVPVETPDVPRMPWMLDRGVKVFRLAAGHVRTEFLPGRVVDAWGFNGSVPGPTIEVREGDRVRLIVENKLPEVFSMHWHGLEVPLGMDGVPGISQDPIPPAGTFEYEFTLRQNGTFFYHSHMPMQEMMGMIGLFIVHPRVAHEPRVDRDFGLVLQEWAILPNNTIPNSLAMEFNWLTLNGKAGPAATPMIVKVGERVRVRMVNLGMDHHPMHLHGNQFVVTGTEAGRIAPSRWFQENTLLVGVAQARDIEFNATYEGDWMLHCHLPHHMMNQMSSMVGPARTSHATGLAPSTMEAGMGIATGHALEAEYGAALGRTVGVGAALARPVAHTAATVLQDPAHAGHAQQPGPTYPGFPQDHYMTMDDAVEKPETYGLRRGWTGGMMGMMTLVRVVRPELFARIEALKAERARRAG
jgi:manganese oxidase